MKQVNNVRLDETVLKTIADLNTSKNTLLQFAGTLVEEDANQLLTAIGNDKNQISIATFLAIQHRTPLNLHINRHSFNQPQQLF
jgi:ribosomal protein L10